LDKMCARNLGFVLLVCIPGVLFAQSATEPCHAPSLNAGYLVPEQEDYTHEQTLNYACDNGSKPAVEGWWATSTCLNGNWSHKPQCIDEKACMPPTIPNAIYFANGWYGDGDKIRIKCDKGYEHKDQDATAICENGTWSSVPVCQKSIEACDAPSKIPHAVIILRQYQEVFAADAKLPYECKGGYTADGADTDKKIICLKGNWTEGPRCSKWTKPGSGQGVSAGGGHTTGSETQSVGGVNNCGNPPKVTNGDVVRKYGSFLEYQCARFYKRVGLKRVECHSDGTWSEVPTCTVTLCSVDTDRSSRMFAKAASPKGKMLLPLDWLTTDPGNF
ncbi:complement factor H-like, partial [Cottoperca gobio]|uniref:Complement factor H-like n=1 Tax=Cottoperca gobio TaxID=56716 RepID=A0A6J2RIU1_COTGO